MTKDLTQPDNLIKWLKRVPQVQLPQAVAVPGFVGNASREGYVRLYLDVQLTQWIEFRNDSDNEEESAVVAFEDCTTDDDASIGGTIVWLKTGAVVEHTTHVHVHPGMEALHPPGNFLRGNIVEKFWTGESMSQTFPDLVEGGAPDVSPGCGTLGVNTCACVGWPYTNPVCTADCPASVGCKK